MNNERTYASPMPGQSVKVAYTGTAGVTAALPPETTLIRLLATTDCFVRISVAGDSAVADVDMYLPASSAEYVEGFRNAKVSAVQVSAGGIIYVTPF